MMNVIMICLGESDTKECRGIIRMLNTLLVSDLSAQEKKRIAHEEYGIPSNKELDREVDDMCNISTLYYERGEVKGMAKGMAEGTLTEKIRTILKLIKKGMSIEDIADTAELSIEETERIIRENS